MTGAGDRSIDRAFGAPLRTAEPERHRTSTGEILGTREGFATEVLVVWALHGFALAAIFVTHARLPVQQLYRVTHTGLAGGTSQTLVFLSHPFSLTAVAITAVILAGARAGLPAVAVRWSGAIAFVSLLLWATLVTLADRTPRPVEAVGVLTMALALGLTVGAVRTNGTRRLAPRARGDRVRLLLGGSLLILALPWLSADLGIDTTDLPLLGFVFVPVHLGHHHGMDGTLLALTALLLSRTLDRMHPPVLRSALSFYLALLLAYGMWRVCQDFWGEQVVGRGWASFHLPQAVVEGRPTGPAVWAGLLLVAGLVNRRCFRPAWDSATPQTWSRSLNGRALSRHPSHRPHGPLLPTLAPGCAGDPSPTAHGLSLDSTSSGFGLAPFTDVHHSLLDGSPPLTGTSTPPG